MDELNSLRKKNGETLDCNEWNKLVSVINYIIEFYNLYPTKLSEFENDINLVSEENIASVIQELVNNGTLSSILGESGADGKSAYLLALENGFIGTVAEWLASLKGLKGSDGKSAFVLAIDNGYTGTLQQWLESLKGQPGINGENGIDGKSAYQSYLDTTSDNPVLSEADWIASLHGSNGQDGQNGLNGITPSIDPTTKHWIIGSTDTGIIAEGLDGINGTNGTNGTDGITPHIDPVTKHWMIGNTDTNVVAEGKDGTASAAGADGKSAYELYLETVEQGETPLSLSEWLNSLKGDDGQNGSNGSNGTTPHIDQTTGNWFIGSTDTGVHAQGPNGNDGSNGTNGTNGTDGITPIVSITNITGGHNVAFSYGTGDSRNTDFNVMDGTSLSNESASSGGNTLSAVTTGEKYNWNNKASIWSGTQAQYDALSPNYDSNTIYIITAAS